MRQVIVGNGAAAISAIKAMREVDHSCQITLVAAEGCRAYSSALFKYYVSGKINREHVFLIGHDFYQKYNVETILGSDAVGLDSSKGILYLGNDKKVEYDNLLIATGSRPVGVGDLSDKSIDTIPLKTIGDADEVVQLSNSAKEIAILGGGLSGLEIADALLRKKSKFILLVSSGQLLSQNVDRACAAIVQNELESLGVSFFLGEDIVAMKKWGKKIVIESASGKKWSVDAVVVAKGMKSNTGLVCGSSVKVHSGILVNEFMRTNVSHIFAAGDVAETKNIITGFREVTPNLLSAFKQGRVAGLNMVGCKDKYTSGLRENVATLFEIPLIVVGLAETQADTKVTPFVFIDPGRKIYRKIIIDGHKLVGATLLGKTGDAGILRNLMINHKDIAPWQERIASGGYDFRNIFFPSVRM
ncbi:NAD(P)/FAD-dependent oxidoreductase [Chloroflexota bacterium]